MVANLKVEFPMLLAGLALVAGLWGFFAMSEIARDGVPHALDADILVALREPGRLDDPVGPPWFEDAVRDVTALGSMAVLTLVTTASILFLTIVGRWRNALFVLVAVGGGQIVSSLLKLGIDRPRPDLVPHLAEVHTLSFPSGHAMLSAVTYLTLGALAARLMPGRAARVYVMAVAVLLTLLVGASRVYLGVHWPSDVVAGWCAGFAWATACWLVAQWLPRRDPVTGTGG